ncbi:MAG: 50S ribosomal protein L18 [Endomicrobiia bacterium]
MNLREQTLPKFRLEKRKLRIRKKIFGTEERPRMSVFKSLKNLEVQIINDETGKTILSLSTLSKELREQLQNKKKSDQAKILGETIAKKALDAGIKKIVFDRRGNKYIGRIKILAESLRSGGLEF